jgi:amino acid adenylation domain-containing protein
VLAAWAVLLGRLSGQDDIVIGTPVANRTRQEVEPLIGFFVNTVALRVKPHARQSVSGFIEQVKQVALQAQDHQQLPFEQVIEAVNPPRSLAHSALFQVMLAWQNAPQSDLELPGLQLQELASPARTVKFDLDITMQQAQGRIVGAVAYATALFDAGTIQRWLGHWHTLVDELMQDDARKLARLPLLRPQDHEQLAAFNRTQQRYPSGTIHELFEAQAARTPDAVALEYEGQQLSYAQLEARANQLARHLKKLGAGADQRVAIALPRSLELMVALLATLKAGGAYVPLDPAYPVERLRHMLQDSQPVVVLSTEALASSLPLQGQARCCLDGAWQPWIEEPETPMNEPVQAHNAAYVIYTSGSTGQPKGVVVEHRGVVNLWAALEQRIYSRHDGVHRVSMNASASFDASVQQWVHLASGRTLVLVPEDTRRDGPALRDWIREQRIDVLDTTPSQLMLMDSARELGLKVVLVGGEAVSAGLWDELACAEGLSGYNIYGPTECTVDAACAAMAPAAGGPNIGRPLPNTQIHILDEQGQEVPIGVAGEIHIAGVQVARGYLHRPALTAQRFVADPYSGEPGARMYRTGDLGRWREDGRIEYLGRNDHQVKIRGFRIELGEIEAALQACVGVREAVVLARGQGADQQLVAYTTGDAAPQALRAALAAQLPGYMVPAAYVPLDAMPLTPNGKLDHKALPDPQTRAYAAAPYEAPQGELETALAEIWRDLLGVAQVGRHDHFFELGGHSLLAVQLIERMRRLQWELPVRALFASPTLAALAQEVLRHTTVEVPAHRITAHTERITPELLPLAQLTQAEIDEVVATVEGGTANVQDIYALTPLQQGMVFHHLMQQHGDAYLNAAVLAFDRQERLQRYLQALQSVIQRHDILRTALVWQGLREPVQVVWRHAVLPVQELDIQAADVAAELKARTERLRLELDRAPLLRAHVAHDARRGRWLLHLMHHHAVMDHTTLELLVEELQAYMGGHEHLLPEPVPFRNFVAQARAVSDEAHEQYFRQQLGDVYEPTAPYGLMDVQGDGSQALEAHVSLPLALAQAIRQQARLQGVSAASVFHLAWALVVARTSARRDVVFGTVLFGRLQGGQGAQRAVGMFMNTLPLRVQLGERGASQALQQTHDALAQLLHHEHASLAQAQRASAVPHPAPLFTALLNYRYAGGSAQLAGQLETDAQQGVEVLHARERTNYPVALSVNDEQGGGFSLDVQVVPPVAPHRLAQQMVHALQQLVQALQSDAQTSLLALPALPAQEAHELAGFNHTPQSDPGGCIHELFEAQAARTPDAVALEYEGQQLSYAQLEARANQLARHLKKLGVKADQRVAIALPRSLELVVALLGTLKAGGAYVPLDPAYPAERLRYMLQDSQPVVLLSTEALAQSLPLQGQALCCLDGLRPLWAEEPDTALNEPVRAHDAAYVIYTSGSTGSPKGVVIEHRGVVNLWAALEQRIYSQHEGVRRVSMNASASFDASVQQWIQLASGRTLVLVEEDQRRDGRALRDWIREQRIDVLDTTPSQWMLMGSARDLGVKVVLVGGEAVSAGLWDEFARAEGWSGYNLYGPTECTVDATCAAMAPGAGGPTIGGPLRNTQIHILNEQGQEVPIGVAGEIYIGGVQVARGYLHRPGLTAQRFVANPYGGPGARMYKTGDLGRWREDGRIEYLGRNDHQVKIRGFRIELGEIEAALQACAGVREAVVLARGEGADQQLVAYTTGDATPQALRAALTARLPGYMVPAAYVPLDTLPLTPNGKLDRRVLPDPQKSAYGASPYEAPQGPLESGLAEIWSELLGVAQVGRHDHFFELGGHSLLAVRLVALAHARGFDLTLQDVYMAPVLSEQALRISSLAQRPDLRVQVIRRHGDQPPLHAMPTGLADTAYAFELAKHIGPGMPMYAHPWPQPIPSTWEQLVREAVESIRSVQASGPYRLLGYSSGARLAHAAAVELERHGEAVEFVGLIDCHAEIERSAAFDRVQCLRSLVEDYLCGHMQETPTDMLEANDDAALVLAQVSTMKTEQEWLEWMRHCEPLRVLAARMHSSVDRLMKRAVAVVDVMAAEHQSSPQVSTLSAGVVQVFFAEEANPADPTLGWERVHGSGVQAVGVPGSHLSLMEPPHISVVGARVAEAVRRIKAQ